MPPVPKPSDKREAILDAALELFVERGFHGTAVPLLAERAGVGAGTIYRYFDGKEALVNALYQQWKGDVLRRVSEGFVPDLAPREQFHRFWRVMGQFVMEHPKAFAFLELHHHSPYLDETSRGYADRLTQMASVLLRDLQAKQIIKPLPVDLLMAVIWGSLVGVVRAGWEGRLDLSLHVFEMAERCAWEAVRT